MTRSGEAMNDRKDDDRPEADPSKDNKEKTVKSTEAAAETGGPQGPEPTRYGDWERKGRCVDF